MILLPRGKPVKENIHPKRVNLANALGKLHEGSFSGYLRFAFPEHSAILILRNGHLTTALFEGPGGRLRGIEGLTKVFATALTSEGRLDVYRLSADLATELHGLVQADTLHEAQDLRLIDIKSLLKRMRDERRSGALRIHANNQVALIFYREGEPLGFFHDGHQDIEKTASSSSSVAKQPGAQIDVLVTHLDHKAPISDWMTLAGVRQLWERQVAEAKSKEETAKASETEKPERHDDEFRRRALVQFKKSGQRHLGTIGTNLVEKEFAKMNGADLSEAALRGFFDSLTKSARLLAGPSSVEMMIGEMKQRFRDLESSFTARGNPRIDRR